MSIISRPVQWVLRPLGYEVNRLEHRREKTYPHDFDAAEIATIERVRPYTMTSDACVQALVGAVRYIVANHIAGDYVECGVWKGGSTMAAALTMLAHDERQRDLWLYDTFEGMPPPTDHDVTPDNITAEKLLESRAEFLNAPLEGVRNAMASTGYPADKVHFIKGKVEDTIPASIPEKIAILRLDTDWYESTRHELEHLYPRLVRGGVILIDDYGYWRGSREATDEYLAKHKVPLLLSRVDDCCRIGIKC